VAYDEIKHNGVTMHIRSGLEQNNYVSFYASKGYHGMFYFPQGTSRETIKAFALPCAELITAHVTPA
jgi:hypothetical protein